MNYVIRKSSPEATNAHLERLEQLEHSLMRITVLGDKHKTPYPVVFSKTIGGGFDYFCVVPDTYWPNMDRFDDILKQVYKGGVMHSCLDEDGARFMDSAALFSVDRTIEYDYIGFIYNRGPDDRVILGHVALIDGVLNVCNLHTRNPRVRSAHLKRSPFVPHPETN